MILKKLYLSQDLAAMAFKYETWSKIEGKNDKENTLSKQEKQYNRRLKEAQGKEE